MTQPYQPGDPFEATPGSTGSASGPAQPQYPPIPTASGRNPAAPASGPGSATELRNERERVQGQLTKLQDDIANGKGQIGEANQASNSENTLIAQYNNRIATLTQQITAAESKQATALAGGSPADKYIIQSRPDGSIITDPTTGKPPLNPNWDGKTDRPQTVTAGTHVLNVANDGTVTVAYNDTDAQNLAARQTAVAESNAKVAALAQQTNDYAARAKVDLDTRVANGEDAASVRAEQAQQLAQLHEQWVQADGDARTKQEALRDYNTDRHAQAQENLSQQQIDDTRAAQQMQDATARRGQDISATTTQRGQDLQSQQAAAATRASLSNARLQAGSSFMGNTLGTLAELNKSVQPGSSAVGDMLVPLMNLGQAFFSQLGGLQSPSDVLGGAGSTDANAAPPAPGPTSPQVGPTAVTPTTAPVVTAGPTPSTTGDWFSQWQARQAADTSQQQFTASMPTPFAQSGLSEGRSMLPAYASGGVVTKPTVALVGEAGPEAIVPIGQQPQLTPQQQFFAQLGAGVAAAQVQQQGAQASQVAAQGAAALGHPPEAAANPMIPGSAQPGIPPQNAAAQARMRPLSPDGTPYATPADVQTAWQGIYQKHGITPPGPPGQGAVLDMSQNANGAYSYQPAGAR